MKKLYIIALLSSVLPILGGEFIGSQVLALDKPLINAAKSGQIVIMKLLIERGAKVNDKDSYGYTPLHYASYYGKLEAVRLLIDNNVKIDAKASCGSTSLHHATVNDFVEIMELLIENNAEIDAKDNDDETPLYWAVGEGKVEAMKILIKKGAKINLKNNDGETLLYCAASERYVEIIKLLIASFIIEFANEASEKPLIEEIKKNYLLCLQQMIFFKNTNNISALDVASEQSIKKLFNDIIEAKKYEDLDKDLKNKIDEQYNLRFAQRAVSEVSVIN